MQWMKRIENADVCRIRTQGIVGGCCFIPISTVLFPAVVSARTVHAGSDPGKAPFFLPVRVLGSRFRNVFLAHLRELFRKGRLRFTERLLRWPGRLRSPLCADGWTASNGSCSLSRPSAVRSRY